jgi:hypothetical protein
MVRGIRAPSPPSKGDPAKMAAAMIDSVDRHPAPLRIALGSDSCTYVRQALGERLADIEAQRDLAFSTGLPAGG